jgi:putative hemolysin
VIGVGILLFVVFFALISEAFFSGSEIAVVASNKALLHKRTSFGIRLERMVEEFRQRPQRILGTALIGTNLSVVASTSLVTLYLRHRYGEAGELYTLLIMSPLLLICGEMIPKVIFQHFADRLAPRVLPLLKLFSYIFYPILVTLIGMADLLMFILRAGREKTNPFLTREQLRFLLTSSASQNLEKKTEHKMIRRVFRFFESTVKEVMIPLIEVQAFKESAPVSEVKKKVRALPYSRYPVFRERVDDVVGILHAFDLIDHPDESLTIKSLMRPAVYVPETMPVDDLLLRMQKENFAMASVVDEYGGCVGIITMEDILEEIVGEIEDEHDEAPRLFRTLGHNRWLIQARMEVDHINENLGLDLPEEEDYETLGGFLLSRLHHIPRAGEILRYQDLTFLVRKASPRGIEEILVSRIPRIETEKISQE